jgi:glycine hydroxymethyltransferase
MLVDVTPLGVTGRETETLLDAIGITVNKNAIPFDKNPPNIASGIRVGARARERRGTSRNCAPRPRQYRAVFAS